MSPRSRARRADRPVLEVAHVSVNFGAVQALQDASLDVYPGQFVGLIGPNGAGKTTCFNVISGFVAPGAGRVRFDGRRVNDWAPARRARAGLARTFQNIGLDKKATVWDNLRVAEEGGPLFSAIGRGAGSDAFRVRAESLLERLDLMEVRDERVDELPIGTAKLVEIACALVREPRVLLLDEPASGLGPAERARLGLFLRELHRESELTILMIEHDMDLAMGSVDYLYVLNFGTSLAEGTPAEVGRNPQVIEAYLGGAA